MHVYHLVNIDLLVIIMSFCHHIYSQYSEKNPNDVALPLFLQDTIYVIKFVIS